jgi:DNA-binding NarL/FixJ family response regulator
VPAKPVHRLSRGVTVTDGSVSDVYRPVPATPRVYVVSDVRLYRDGLVAGLARQSELDVLGAGWSGEVLDRIVPLRPQVLLLDLAARDSLAIPRRAQQVLPGLLVVAFAVAEREENILACAEAGISGYVAQDGSMEDLSAAVQRALRGEVMCSPRVAALLFSRAARPCPCRPGGASTLPRGWRRLCRARAATGSGRDAAKSGAAA